MSRILFTSLLVVSFSAFADMRPTIIGGNEYSKSNPAPTGIVEVLGRNRSMCTGALIAPRFVLTAAHCGSSESVVFQNGKTVKVSQQKFHPQYRIINSREISKYDVHVVQLSQDAPPQFEPFELANEDLVEGAKVIYAGYGLTATDGESGILRWVEMPITIPENSSYVSKGTHADEAVIQEVLDLQKKEDIKGHMVTITDGKTGFCMGDSGGPGYIVKNGKPVTVQITTAILETDTRKGCESGIYMGENVKFHSAWIQQAMSDMEMN